MEIDINQKMISVGDKYQVFIDGKQTHYASRAFLQLMPEILLFEMESKRPKMTIDKEQSFLKTKYSITRWDNNILVFESVSILKLVYQCDCGEDHYELYGHYGRKYSIFKNGSQVAWWEKKGVSWFSGDNYKIIADIDCNVLLLISFCLIVDNFSDQGVPAGGIVNFDLGNIGFSAKKFDESWQAKV